MIEFIRNLFSPVKKNDSFLFDDNEQAFQMACAYLTSPTKEGVMVPAIVMDGKTIMKWASATRKLDDGKQETLLMVASPSGGFISSGSTIGDGEELKAGDLVAWIPHKRSSFAKTHDIWPGSVTAKLDHAYILGQWRIKSIYKERD